ncbi:DNA polymerase III subunit beta [Pseudooceanicola marinus]|uniref:DNA polymerase III subunit beta n=1 Tax=Pseudooceanicola marinus TaxID=396013 RepID=UPI001CD55E5C|nr:DNA polymerase III subunit beta [Pseudooceanicola marinus]MCA1337380.1 DNA polymerase III subunit beta [Pseudooceanicola marinus]
MLYQSSESMTPVKVRAVIPRQELKAATTLLNKVIDRRNTIPILGYLRIEVRNNQVILKATDLDAELTITLEAETEGEADIMVAARILAGFAPTAAGPVTLSLIAKQDMDEIRLDDGETIITLNDHMPAADYPALTSPKLHPAFSISQDQASRLIRLSQHCISNEETRYYLNGIFLTADPERGTVRAVATDGHRMARIDTDEPADLSGIPGDERKGVIIPRAYVGALHAIFGKGGNEPVSFALAESHLRVECANVELRCKTIDGTYPDYARVIPPISQAMRAQLSGPALKRMAALAEQICSSSWSIVELNLGDGRMIAKSPHAAEGSRASVPLQGDVAEGCVHKSLGFNIRYLSAQGSVTPSFTLSTLGPGEPARIVSDDPNALWVLMPARL